MNATIKNDFIAGQIGRVTIDIHCWIESGLLKIVLDLALKILRILNPNFSQYFCLLSENPSPLILNNAAALRENIFLQLN